MKALVKQFRAKSQQLEELVSEHGERELEVLCDVNYALVLQRSGSAAVVP